MGVVSPPYFSLYPHPVWSGNHWGDHCLINALRYVLSYHSLHSMIHRITIKLQLTGKSRLISSLTDLFGGKLHCLCLPRTIRHLTDLFKHRQLTHFLFPWIISFCSVLCCKRELSYLHLNESSSQFRVPTRHRQLDCSLFGWTLRFVDDGCLYPWPPNTSLCDSWTPAKLVTWYPVLPRITLPHALRGCFRGGWKYVWSRLGCTGEQNHRYKFLDPHGISETASDLRWTWEIPFEIRSMQGIDSLTPIHPSSEEVIKLQDIDFVFSKSRYSWNQKFKLSINMRRLQSADLKVNLQGASQSHELIFMVISIFKSENSSYSYLILLQFIFTLNYFQQNHSTE